MSQEKTPIAQAIEKITEARNMITALGLYSEGYEGGLSDCLDVLKNLLPAEIKAMEKDIRTEAKEHLKKHFDLPDTIEDNNTLGGCFHDFVDLLVSFKQSLPENQKSEWIKMNEYVTFPNEDVWVINMNGNKIPFMHDALKPFLKSHTHYCYITKPKPPTE